MMLDQTMWACLLVFCGALMSAASSDIDSSVRHLKAAPRVKRVIGGVDVEEGQWPWLVSLEGRVPTKTFWGIPYAYKNFYCTGSLVNTQWVMTAAHCFRTPDSVSRQETPKYWHAKSGDVQASHNWWDHFVHLAGRVTGNRNWLMWRLHADKIIIHPSYDASRSWLNDIALIKLEKEIPVNDYSDIGLVSLPSSSDRTWPPEGAQCIMKGWGCTEHGGRISDVAQAVEMPKVDDGVCVAVFGMIDLNTRFCSGYNLASKGICPGDSGGPLVCKDGNEWVQAGIASFTSANRPGEVPGVFTRVTYYRDWIIRNLS